MQFFLLACDEPLLIYFFTKEVMFSRHNLKPLFFATNSPNIFVETAADVCTLAPKGLYTEYLVKVIYNSRKRGGKSSFASTDAQKYVLV